MRKTKGFGMTQTINVVDDICGSGKTSWAIQQINDSIHKKKKLTFGESADHEEKFIYVTPFLNEVERIKTATDIEFVEPDTMKGKGSKFKHLQALITVGKSIVTTHQLFKMLDLETLDLIEESGYTLIMDEVASVLAKYDITKKDIEMLIKGDVIAVGEKGKIQWLDNDYTGKFSDMKILAESDNLYLQNDVAVFWTMNTRAFEAFDDVYILTYLFDGQHQCYYYKANDIKFKKFSVKNNNRRYELIEYNPTYEPRKELYDLLTIYADEEGKTKKSPLNSNYDSRALIKPLTVKQKHYQLSSTWFKMTATDADLKQLNNNLRNYFRNVSPTENNDLFWTTVKSAAPSLKNAKCKLNKKDDRNSDNFVSFNARATNNYGHCTSMAFVYNRFMNPLEKSFFSTYGVTVDEDQLAVSDLIQFLFRGCIRNGKPMNCYIPSERMRKLLKDWSEYKI